MSEPFKAVKKRRAKKEQEGKKKAGKKEQQGRRKVRKRERRGRKRKKGRKREGNTRKKNTAAKSAHPGIEPKTFRYQNWRLTAALSDLWWNRVYPLY